jgi:ABC-type proline/glycine betaine transport system permease subunit
VSFPLRVAGVVLFGIFAIIVNTSTGASQIDPALEDVGRAFMASPGNG